MFVVGKYGILEDPYAIYSQKNSDGTFDIVAESKKCSVSVYRDVPKNRLGEHMNRLARQMLMQGTNIITIEDD
jgi:hypothetical protein